MESVVVALVAIAAGSLVALYGTRAFFFLLPVLGFVVGFALGADLVNLIAGDGMLATIAGWVVGLIVGVGLALVSGLWFYGAVIVLGVSAGYTAGSGLLVALGLDPGFLTIAAGLLAGVALGLVVILLDAPTVLVAVVTSFAGTAWVLAGLFLIVNRIEIADLEGGGAIAAIGADPVRLVFWLGAGGVALGYQLLEVRRLKMDRLDRDEYRF